MTRTILHIDMNAFFASVEQQSNPALRGQPIAVTGSEARTVILTASYEARAYGVKTGMRVGEARKLCPQLRLVPVSNRLYGDVSRRIMALLGDYTPLVEVFSIDEAFLDVTASLGLFGSAERIAWQIKARIKAQFGLTCSIGIAPNKLLAKLASEMEKPDGLTILPAETLPAVLEYLPIRELCGIGRSTERQLQLLGIATCGQLGRFPLEILHKKFGVLGAHLQRMGRGEDDSPVLPAEAEGPVKSVGHSTTLSRDLSDRREIDVVLLQLAEMVGRRARRYGVAGRTVTVTVRYADFTTFSRQQRQPQLLNLSCDLYQAARTILDSIVLEQPVRLLGVSISGLEAHSGQLELFDADPGRQRLTAAMDAVNNRHGDFCVMFGSLLERRDRGSHVISPSWRPQGIRKVDVE